MTASSHKTSSHARAAAFYDLDGTLVSTNLVHSLAYFARNEQGLRRSVFRSLRTLFEVPLYAAADFYSRKVFNNIFFKRYEGVTEDRLRHLSAQLFEDVIEPSIYPGAYELVAKSKSLGLRQVLVTGALDFTVLPLIEHMGFDDFVANRLEFVGGVATGRLLPPVMANATKASWIRVYTEREGLSLSDSYCYSDSMSDLPMLAVVGHPTAVNPDIRLRATAKRHDWPILDLR